MRNLVFIFAILFSFAGMASLSHAQDAEVDGEALIESFLPDGVTLETATAEQIRSAMSVAINRNANSQAALNAITQAATNSPRVTNKVSSDAAAYVVAGALSARVYTNALIGQPRYETVEAEVAADVISYIIRNSNLTLTQVNDLVSSIESSITNVSAPSLSERDNYLRTITNQIRDSAGQAISEQRNEVCTVSNDGTTCVPA